MSKVCPLHTHSHTQHSLTHILSIALLRSFPLHNQNQFMHTLLVTGLSAGPQTASAPWLVPSDTGLTKYGDWVTVLRGRGGAGEPAVAGPGIGEGRHIGGNWCPEWLVQGQTWRSSQVSSFAETVRDPFGWEFIKTCFRVPASPWG